MRGSRVVRRIVACLFGLTLVLGVSTKSVNATTYTFEPTRYPVDLADLGHYYYYTWGIGSNFNGPITGASLTISNITNWDNNENIIYMHLLDDPRLGITVDRDTDNVFSDAFAGMGVLFAAYIDTNGYQNTENLVYDFSALGLLDTLNAYAGNGRFGFGFDADCHFYNDGFKLTIETMPVPEPTMLVLLGFGLIGVAATRKKKIQA